MQTAHKPSWNLLGPEIIEVSGRLDSSTAPEIEQDAKIRVQCGARSLILDCAGLNYLTATGMHAILDLARLMQAKEGKFALCNLHGQAKEIYDACGFPDIIPAYDTQDEAFAKIAA